ncbi:MAG: hypothetical protein QGI60_01995 [archaeon]|jgi:hypothetical protein|nr:hypothetical protein [archaeon]
MPIKRGDPNYIPRILHDRPMPVRSLVASTARREAIRLEAKEGREGLTAAEHRRLATIKKRIMKKGW